jgi:type I restriction enzyme S subunit
LLTSRGTLGVPYIVNENDRFHFADGNLTWFRNFRHLDSHYLKYFFVAPLGKAELSKCVIGSSQAAYTIASLKKIEIPLPPLPVQQRIVGILSAYDELIENSQRRINTLEQTARNLYREWFVRENFPTQKQSLNLQKRTLGELCVLVKEPFSDQLHNDRPLLDLSRMPQHSLAPEQTGKASELTTSRILFEPSDILFGAIRCYLHKVVAAHFPGVTNTSVLVLRPKKDFLRTLVAIIASDTDTIRWADTHSTGTKMPVINWGVFQTMPAPLPSDALAEKFESIAGTMLDQIGILSTQIQNLRKTRDLLLPRLLSGQIAMAE